MNQTQHTSPVWLNSMNRKMSPSSSLLSLWTTKFYVINFSLKGYINYICKCMSILWFSLFLLYLKSRVQSAYSHSLVLFHNFLTKNVRDWALDWNFSKFYSSFGRNKHVTSCFVLFSLFVFLREREYSDSVFYHPCSVESVAFACILCIQFLSFWT